MSTGDLPEIHAPCSTASPALQPEADTMADIHPVDPAITRLTGSSVPTGEAPSFEPIANGQGRASEAASPAVGGRDAVFDLIETHRDAYAAFNDALTDEFDHAPLECAAEDAAMVALVGHEPASLVGIQTLAEYLDHYIACTGDHQYAHASLATISAALKRLTLSAGRQNDAELVALGLRLDKLHERRAETYKERLRLEVLYEGSLPPVPSALLVDCARPLGVDVDHWGTADISTDEGEGCRYYVAKGVARLLAAPRMKADYEPHPGLPGDLISKLVPDDEAQARAVEVIAAFEAWDIECQKHSEAMGHTAAIKEDEETERAFTSTLDEILMTAPNSLRGLAVLARAALRDPCPQAMMAAVADYLDIFADVEAQDGVRSYALFGSELRIAELGRDYAAAVARSRIADETFNAGIETTESLAACEPAWAAEKQVRYRIVNMRSSLPSAIQLKIRAYLDTRTHLDWRIDLDELVLDAVKAENGPWSDAFAASIVRDLVTAYMANIEQEPSVPHAEAA